MAQCRTLLNRGTVKEYLGSSCLGAAAASDSKLPVGVHTSFPETLDSREIF